MQYQLKFLLRIKTFIQRLKDQEQVLPHEAYYLRKKKIPKLHILFQQIEKDNTFPTHAERVLH